MLKTPVTLLLLLGLLLFAYNWGMDRVTAPLGPKYVKPCVPQAIQGGKLESGQVLVRVHNASKLRGKAADVAQQLKSAGFRVTKVGNAENPSQKTRVVGFSADTPEVALVAGWFVNAEKAGDQRADHSVEVIIGNDYNGMQKQAPVNVPVSTPTLCLPEPPTTIE
ncbi:LytR C-terminal domain-containing protein [Mariniluteicoccus flavus]